ncbi:DUF4231 domain-containing protein [Nostoc sp. TCL26-01]|uniref:DUF4231 domain-containing protein n=1 Tax=Nostoc sp. TCL26-01 TaxID=2576904 RepID=UPI0015BB67E5|nr:DUF4231 domain-containing protein [Nostoc sp. TCL26-01]QLE56574.1 DUF4231 domain-containing protein [Nostoc sp. TCL26-01]
MGKKNSYQEFLKQDFDSLFASMNLGNLQKHFLRSRWLEQLLWMENKANQARDRYYFLRITTIVGGIILPALVSFNINNEPARKVLIVSTFGLSQVVAISAAIEEFFHYGERWRHYRRTAESLKTQAWQFSQLTGVYQNYTSHEQAFSIFAGQVEDIIQRDVEVYATQVVQEQKSDKQTRNDYNSLLESKTTNSEDKEPEQPN